MSFTVIADVFFLPKQMERLEELADASRRRVTELYSSPKPPPVRRRFRSRQYPGGRPNLRRSMWGRRWR
ncbi:hypothetical protein J3S85_25390 [Streptomyces lavenduligriseus]|nr:hypothetical protein J3S85_25390 [Streptomyces lavenduligriseus]